MSNAKRRHRRRRRAQRSAAVHRVFVFDVERLEKAAAEAARAIEFVTRAIRNGLQEFVGSAVSALTRMRAQRIVCLLVVQLENAELRKRSLAWFERKEVRSA